MAKQNVHKIDDAFWFRIEHAAKLAGTTPKKLRELTASGALEWTQAPNGDIVVLESAIAAMRRLGSISEKEGARELAKREAAAPKGLPRRS